MRSEPRLVTMLVSAALAVGSAAQAAAAEPVGTLARVSGTAVVNQGAQYVVGREGMALREGDRLLALEGGSALVKFADGCEYRLEDDELLVVPAVSTCVARDAVATGSHRVPSYNAVAEGQSAGAVNGSEFHLAAVGETTAAASLAFIPPAGAAAVALGAAVGGDDEDDRISP